MWACGPRCGHQRPCIHSPHNFKWLNELKTITYIRIHKCDRSYLDGNKSLYSCFTVSNRWKKNEIEKIEIDNLKRVIWFKIYRLEDFMKMSAHFVRLFSSPKDKKLYQIDGNISWKVIPSPAPWLWNVYFFSATTLDLAIVPL